MKQQNLDNLMQLIHVFGEEGCSYGLHTTMEEEVAQKICDEGLKLNAHAVEGTLKLRGSALSVNEKDLDFFFPYTDYTVIVLIPEYLESKRIDDNQGGYKPLCEFSRFVAFANNYPDKFPEFHTKDKTDCIPSQFVLGYYDKDYKFVKNEKSAFFDSKKEYLKDFEQRYNDNLDFFNFMKNFLFPQK